MNEYFKELSKTIMLFANMFTILIFFQKANWFFGIYILINLYLMSALIYYGATLYNKEEDKKDE